MFEYDSAVATESYQKAAMQKSEFKQSLLVKHYEDTTFKALEANNGAPRPQFLYRRLGAEEATGGAYDAHVIQGVPGTNPPLAEHKHTELDFLFVYVLRGWMSFHYQSVRMGLWLSDELVVSAIYQPDNAVVIRCKPKACLP
jgi:hypothetical protein